MKDLEERMLHDTSLVYEDEVATIERRIERNKESLEQQLNYIRTTIVFNDYFIEEVSFAIDIYNQNTPKDPETGDFTCERLISDFSLKFLSEVQCLHHHRYLQQEVRQDILNSS